MSLTRTKKVQISVVSVIAAVALGLSQLPTGSLGGVLQAFAVCPPPVKGLQFGGPGYGIPGLRLPGIYRNSV